jgi:6-phosphofructokinase 1
MKKLAILTSGGDAPGMNAAIRAVVRTALSEGMEVFGVQNGFSGLMMGDFRPLSARDVGGILQQGGTILGSARCIEFKTPEGKQHAYQQLIQRGINNLVVVGGNGSQMGAYELLKEGINVVGIASTIDNDLWGSEMTLGVDSALNVILEAIDRIKVTASSHRRGFIVEVMGRDCGYLALMAGLAGGAESIIIPEADTDPAEVAAVIDKAYQRGKKHALIIVSEGAKWNAQALEQYFLEHKDYKGFSLRTTILGHVQRGGKPTPFDRLLGTRFGFMAVKTLLAEESGVLVGLNKGQVTTTALKDVVGKTKTPNLMYQEMNQILSL